MDEHHHQRNILLRIAVIDLITVLPYRGSAPYLGCI